MGDITGFAAATYLRGIDFVQIPTTLLAQVDSSVGGKTGVDFDQYKNMVGAFYMPKLVYMNLSVLKTLDDRQYYAGMGEVMKYGLIKNASFYEWILDNMYEIHERDMDTLEDMVVKSCTYKKLVVEKDPTEKGERAILNFGHTIGHAIEKYADNETITALAATVAEQWAAYQANPTGYFDSVELMELDTMIGGKGVNDPALVETLCSNSADAIDWLGEQGITLHSVSSFGGASVKRIHRPVNAEGKTVSVGSYMIPLLEENCEKAGVQMMLNTTATEILTDDNGAAVGIKATGASGETITINAKAVVLTTGGFGANLDMVVEYKPELKGFMTTNAPGILGQGIKMAQTIGADTVDMDQIQIHPTVEANTAALITEGLRGDGAVLINAEGKRFIDEVGTRDVVSAAEIAQTGSYSWLVVDQAMADASSVIQGYIKKGYTVTGETYEELGKAMGVDETAFAETMNTWNGYVEAKNDPDFGRTSFANKLDTAPYYAIKVTAGVHHTMGGLKINTNTEVLNENGEVIPGLFAAGEVTGGVHGANRLGGNAVADFTVFGRIAGAAASKYAA